jgi:tetratricopeptide (TPR) repeat protein
MNARAKTLLSRFILFTLLLSGAGIGFFWLLLPILRGIFGAGPFGPITATEDMLFISSIPAIMTIALACAGAISFSGYGYGSQEHAGDYAFFGAAFTYIILFALGVSVFTAFAIPSIQTNMLYKKNAIPGALERPQEAPISVLREGIRLYYNTSYSIALERLKTFLEYDPRNSIALWYQGRAAAEYAHMQRVRAAPAQNEQTAPLFRRGYDFLLDGNFLLAIMEFERVLQINPNHSLAQQHMEIARNRLQEAQSRGPEEIARDGLRARLIIHANEGIALYEANNWRACLKIMDEILLLDAANPTALQYSKMARDRIAKTDFLDEEVRAMPALPAYRNILVPIHNGGLLYAGRASFIGDGLWLSDFWIIQPRDSGENAPPRDIQLIGGSMAKLTSTNTLIIRDARLTWATANGPSETRREARYTTTLNIDLPLAASAALAYSERIMLDPITILRHQAQLYSLGWPDVPLWRTFNRQVTQPFTIFLMGALASAWGWRFRKRHLQRRSPLRIVFTFPILLAFALFFYTALIRLLDSLNSLLDAWNIAGWVLAPVWAVLLLFVTFFLLGRIMRAAH